MKEVGDGLLAGKDQYKFMRGFFGLLVCSGIGVVVTFLTKPRPLEEVRGLVWGTVADALAVYRGRKLQLDGEDAETEAVAHIEREKEWHSAQPLLGETDAHGGKGHVPLVRISPSFAAELGVMVDDLLYLTDSRFWLGGLRASHVMVSEISEDVDGNGIELGPNLWQSLVGERRKDLPLKLQRLY